MKEESLLKSRLYKKWQIFFLPIKANPQLVESELIDLLAGTTSSDQDSHASTITSEPFAKILRLFESGLSSYEIL
jgi:hypothetical protein